MTHPLLLGLALLAQQPAKEPLAVIVSAKGPVELVRDNRTAPVRPFESKKKHSWVLLIRGDRVRCGAGGEAVVYDGRVAPAGKTVKVASGQTLLVTGDASRLPARSRVLLSGLGKTFGASMGAGGHWVSPLDRGPSGVDGLVFRALAGSPEWRSIRLLDTAGRELANVPWTPGNAMKAASRSGLRLSLPAGEPPSVVIVSVRGEGSELARRRVEIVEGAPVPRDDAKLEAMLREVASLDGGSALLELLGELYESGRLGEMLDVLIRCAWLDPDNEFWRDRALELAGSVGVPTGALEGLLPRTTGS